MGIYLNAARLVADGTHEFSCNAIASSPMTRQYEKLFRPPEEIYSGDAWGAAWGDDFPKSLLASASPEARQCRVLALCLMAAIVGEEA